MAKILIADDERDIRDLLTFTLMFAGHQVIPAANGEEAYHTALKEIPDVILLDVRMPKMTGYEACKHIKEEPTTQHIPVLFLSAKGQDSEVQMGYEVGATDYILKPFSPDQVTERVRKLLVEIKKA